ncbi:hypothetical protein JCM17960_08670 [Magnetospira thiophila]
MAHLMGESKSGALRFDFNRRSPKDVVLDMDSSVSPTYGDQEDSAYNGHFGCSCYPPLFPFNHMGDLERCRVRGADGWRDVLVQVVERYKDRQVRIYVRGDAAFDSSNLYEHLESEGILCAIYLPANKALQESIAHLLIQPVGRPPNLVLRYYASFSYQTGSRDRKRREVPRSNGISATCIFVSASS